MLVFRHPKYYAELRKKRKEFLKQQASSAKLGEPQATSVKRQAQRIKRQATSVKLLDH